MKKLTLIVVAISVLALLPACSAIRRGAATERYCEEHSKDHVYGKPLTGLKSHVMADIAMHRPMELPQSSGKQGFSSKVSYKIDENAEAPIDDERHFIMKGSDAIYEAIAVTPDTTRVQITNPGTGARMFDREWLLLKRIEPETAGKIIADAEGHLDENGNPKN